jgi:hypothetical protein
MGIKALSREQNISLKINPCVFASSLKNLDLDKLEEDLLKEIHTRKIDE